MCGMKDELVPPAMMQSLYAVSVCVCSVSACMCIKPFLNMAPRNLREVPSATSPSFEKLREGFYRPDSFADLVLRSLGEVFEAD